MFKKVFFFSKSPRNENGYGTTTAYIYIYLYIQREKTKRRVSVFWRFVTIFQNKSPHWLQNKFAKFRLQVNWTFLFLNTAHLQYGLNTQHWFTWSSNSRNFTSPGHTTVNFTEAEHKKTKTRPQSVMSSPPFVLKEPPRFSDWNWPEVRAAVKLQSDTMALQ